MGGGGGGGVGHEADKCSKAPPRVCSYGKYSTRVCVERLIQHEAKPSAVFASRYPRVPLYFSYTQARRCFKCYMVLHADRVWLGAIFSSAQTAAIFGDKDISRCSYNLFLVVERTNRISLASFSNLQCPVTHMINRGSIVLS